MKLAERGDTNSILRRWLRRAAGISAALIMTASALGVAGAPTAQADTVTTWWSDYSFGCLTDSGVGTIVIQPCYGNGGQQWNVHPWADNTFEFKTTYYNWCLDDSSLGLRPYPCNQSRFQSWYQIPDGYGHVALKNQATGNCLDDSQYGLRMFACNGLFYQEWGTGQPPAPTHP